MIFSELDKMIRARDYMQSLSKGINPIDKSLLPDIDEESKKRLGACFEYLAIVLSKLIESGGQTAEVPDRYPFAITEGQKLKIPVSEDPINITSLVSNINSAVSNPGMRKLRANSVTGWLVENKFLQPEKRGDKTFRIITDTSHMIGISSITCYGKDGKPYAMNIYNKDAQKYIIDNLEAIIEFEKTRGLNRQS